MYETQTITLYNLAIIKGIYLEIEKLCDST